MMHSIKVDHGRSTDFDSIEDFVASSIYPAFDHPDLTDEQRAANERVVRISREACESALEKEWRCIFVVRDEKDQLAGFVIVDEVNPESPEIDWLIVEPKFHGTGVAQALMAQALQHIGSTREVHLTVIHYNTRAIRFYEKCGFRDTGLVASSHKIPHRLMIRAATSL
jgi:ribosomal protein S18 acetylase RimI-like enzyme